MFQDAVNETNHALRDLRAVRNWSETRTIALARARGQDLPQQMVHTVVPWSNVVPDEIQPTELIAQAALCQLPKLALTSTSPVQGARPHVG